MAIVTFYIIPRSDYSHSPWGW